MPFHEPGIKPWPQAELEEKDVVQDGITHPEHIQLYSVNLNGRPSYHFLFINISELPAPQQAAHQRGIILLDTPRFHSERSPRREGTDPGTLRIERAFPVEDIIFKYDGYLPHRANSRNDLATFLISNLSSPTTLCAFS